MYKKEELCGKIIEFYPDIGQCGIDVDVHYSRKKNSWIVDMEKDGHRLQHHLEKDDARYCMAGEQCTALGLEIAQLRKNIEGRQF